VRDRLKEFDAPNVANYIDPDTIDRINNARRPPAYSKPKKETQSKEQILEENK
jgi:hypothetical protein